MNSTHGTREGWRPQSKQDCDLVLRELHEILASPHFCNSKRYPALLEYIVTHTLDGKSEMLKERTLGVEVFDRPPTYDTNADTVVRYTAGEVRKRLSLYYSEQARNPAIRISLPAGSYIPEFFQGTAGPEEMGADGDAGAHGAEAAGARLHSGEHHGEQDAFPHAAGGEGLEAREDRRSRAAARTLHWLAIAALLIALFAAGYWWRDRASHPQTAVDDFWEPLLHDRHPVVLCTGSVVFQQNSYSGVHTAGKDIEYPFVSLQNASAIAQVAGSIERGGVDTKLVAAAFTPLTELREHSVALIGGYNNPWSLRLTEPLRFHFSPNTPDYLIPIQNPAIVDRTQAETHWQRDVALPYSSADDYALVARFRNPSTDGWVVVVAGLGRNGTEAAALFATSPRYLEQLRERIGKNFASQNVEAVLKVNVIDGKTGAPSIMAVHVW
jgi:hypothetical protein